MTGALKVRFIHKSVFFTLIFFFLFFLFFFSFTRAPNHFPLPLQNEKGKKEKRSLGVGGKKRND